MRVCVVCVCVCVCVNVCVCWCVLVRACVFVCVFLLPVDIDLCMHAFVSARGGSKSGKIACVDVHICVHLGIFPGDASKLEP
jgi:hypothetical protein